MPIPAAPGVAGADPGSALIALFRQVNQQLRDELHGLSDDAINWIPTQDANSIATIITHVVGSEGETLRCVAGVACDRDRDAEFVGQRLTSGDLLRLLDEADALLADLEPRLDASSLVAESRLPTLPAEGSRPGLTWLVGNYGHAREHVGQIQITKQLHQALVGPDQPHDAHPPRLVTARLELTPLSAQAAAALPDERDEASRRLGARLHPEWPGPDLMGILPRQAAASEEKERYGIWAVIERASNSVVGDIGFHGPADAAGTVEIGYAVIPARRRRGYAAEAASALIPWALSQPEVRAVIAECDPANIASVATLERIGFRRTGEADGLIRWRNGGGSTEVPVVG